MGTSGGGQEFNDFVGPSTTNQNGTGSTTTTTTSSNNQNSFFADFAEMSTSTSVNSTNSNSNENQPQKQQTMSKDSIMALFNQKHTAAPASNPMFATTQPQGFVHGGQGGGGVGSGGMQIPASFGLGVGLQQLHQQPQQPLQAQHFAQPQPNNAASTTAFATLNNPFLGMVVQTDPTTNNIFGSGFTTTPTGHNFLQ